MANLAVNIAGVELKNPVITASGCCGFGREFLDFYPLSALGGISLKGTTLNPREGNPPHRIAEAIYVGLIQKRPHQIGSLHSHHTFKARGASHGAQTAQNFSCVQIFHSFPRKTALCPKGLTARK